MPRALGKRSMLAVCTAATARWYREAAALHTTTNVCFCLRNARAIRPPVRERLCTPAHGENLMGVVGESSVLHRLFMTQTAAPRSLEVGVRSWIIDT